MAQRSRDPAPDDTLVSGPALARTYQARSHADPWELVLEYEDVIDYAARHPTLGDYSIANRLDLPRGRIREWLRDDDPARPDCVRGIDVAEQQNWINVEEGDREFQALNDLVAWVFSGGSISTDTFVPRFTLDGVDARERIEEVLSAVGVTYRLDHEDVGNRATEAVPEDHASVLGRVLVVLGAPTGSKNPREALTLPPYLDRVGTYTRLQFARTYVLNRGHFHTDKGTVTFREDRSSRYLHELAGFLEGVSESDVTTTGGNVIVSVAAARSLGIR